ncbi:uncharacterized protein LOC111907822 [Lactuca sativa]|uniref:uncharacterized protein LOC111907822 n=1 Tax=Lactuca sativa TaxID=4236 RepID=UPI000CD9E66C|nr:uncharacterized protein LOC111907822 [Lactuca sativa]
MNEEMEALHRNIPCEITNLPSNQKPMGCKCIYKIKYKANGEVERYNPDLRLKVIVRKKAPRKNKGGTIVVLLVYVDDIVITGIEVIDKFDGICLTQRKYCLELIHEFGKLPYKPVKTHLDLNFNISKKEIDDKDVSLSNITEYQKLIGK